MPGGATSSKQDAERPYFVSCTLCGKHQLDVRMADNRHGMPRFRSCSLRNLSPMCRSLWWSQTQSLRLSGLGR
jgi:hypothetical protein